MENANWSSYPYLFCHQVVGKFQVIYQLHKTFGDVSSFLHRDDLPPATTAKLLRIVEDKSMCRNLKMEISITVDAMEPFIKVTYTLEGDGPIALGAYQQ